MKGRLQLTPKRLAILLGRILVAAILTLVFVIVMAYSMLFDSGVKQISGDDEEPSNPLPAITLPPYAPAYVALGDSYSAGEGVEPYLPDSDDINKHGNRCHRSTQAYAERLRFSGGSQLRFRACSGAVIANMHTKQKTGPGVMVPPQLVDGILGPDVGLVTITIGGNDAGFAHIVELCATNLRCSNEEFDDSFDDRQKSRLKLK